MPITLDVLHQTASETAIACAQACRACAAACLEESDVAMFRECIRRDRDCAWICDLASAYLIAGSPFSERACELCAEICDACAGECLQHKNMAHCLACAEACLRCAEACRALVPALA